MKARCPGCNEYFALNNMRRVRDIYWCDDCRKAGRYKE